MKVLPAGAELFHSDRQTDRHDEANIPFVAILWTLPKCTKPENDCEFSIS